MLIFLCFRARIDAPLYAHPCAQVRLEELGRGAGGVVFKAIHVPTLTVVAVKQIYVEDDATRRQVRSIPAARLRALAMHVKPPLRGAFGWSCPRRRLSSCRHDCACTGHNASPASSLRVFFFPPLLVFPFQMTHELSLLHAFNARPLRPSPPANAAAANDSASSPPASRPQGRVVQLHDAYTDPALGSCVCLVLEFMARGALDAPVKRREPLTEPQLAHVAGSVAAALADLRRRRLLHRDVKPSVLH